MKPNIFLLVIDSFRSDKFFSNPNIKKPNIDFLISEGTYFSQTISSADATLLSWSSIFTGLYPFKTGIRSENFNKLDPNIPTLFTILEKFNYNFYSHVMKIGNIIGLFPKFKNNDSFYDLYKNLHEGKGKLLTEKIFKFLDHNYNNPWFYFLHLYDLHDPVLVPKSFNNSMNGVSSYDRQIFAIDSWLGELIKKINFENTLLIITSDHGKYDKTITGKKILNFEHNMKIEKFISNVASYTPKFLEPSKNKIFLYIESILQRKKEKNIEKLNLSEHEKISLSSGKLDLEHFLYDDKIRVPLLINGYGVVKNKIISQLTRSVDILPTILDITGNEIPNQVFDGQSLKPLLFDKPVEEKPVYIESNPLLMLKSKDVIGIRTSKFKYFRDKDNPKNRTYLFDLENDKKEITNLADVKPEIVKEMEHILEKILENPGDIKQESNNNETKIIEDTLKRLGYM